MVVAVILEVVVAVAVVLQWHQLVKDSTGGRIVSVEEVLVV